MKIGWDGLLFPGPDIAAGDERPGYDPKNRTRKTFIARSK